MWLQCSGIPFTNVTAVADAVKRFLNRTAPTALVYINECSTPFDECQKANPSIACWGPIVPASIDVISLDIYHHAGCESYINCSIPASEVGTAQAFLKAHVVPRMLPHQRLFVVPGTFGDWNSSRSGPIAAQQDDVVAKLNGYWEWAQSDPLIVGINCWHWTTIPGLYKRAPGIIPFYYGVDAMPKVVARLKEIGAIIREAAIGNTSWEGATGGNLIDGGGSPSSWTAFVPPYPPLAPPFPQAWQLNRSTIIHTSNKSGWTDTASAARYGIISFDAQNAERLWLTENRSLCTAEEALVEQARRVKAASPSTKVLVYRNVMWALQWLRTNREAMEDPSKENYFLRYRVPTPTAAPGDIYYTQAHEGNQYLLRSTNITPASENVTLFFAS